MGGLILVEKMNDDDMWTGREDAVVGMMGK